MENTDSSKSWFCVLNNPQEIYSGEPCDIAETVLEAWIKDKPTRTAAVAYCISADGLIHLHMVLEDTNKARFSAIKRAFPKAHIEPTRGRKEQAEDYINKRGKFEEKGEQVVYIARYGEIKGFQGSRREFEVIEELIEQGYTPRQIENMSFGYRRYSKMIREAFFDKRSKETPYFREVRCIWHVGDSGSGKSYTMVRLKEHVGEENIYLVSDYETGGLDMYNGEPILFLDEFRGQIRYSVLLTMLQGYKAQIHARYSNVIGLWSEVHITSVLPPEKVYSNMVSENREIDTIKQLYRRITCIVYHWKDKSGGYHEYDIPMSEYKDYESLKYAALGGFEDAGGVPSVPFL